MKLLDYHIWTKKFVTIINICYLHKTNNQTRRNRIQVDVALILIYITTSLNNALVGNSCIFTKICLSKCKTRLRRTNYYSEIKSVSLCFLFNLSRVSFRLSALLRRKTLAYKIVNSYSSLV